MTRLKVSSVVNGQLAKFEQNCDTDVLAQIVLIDGRCLFYLCLY